MSIAWTPARVATLRSSWRLVAVIGSVRTGPTGTAIETVALDSRTHPKSVPRDGSSLSTQTSTTLVAATDAGFSGRPPGSGEGVDGADCASRCPLLLLYPCPYSVTLWTFGSGLRVIDNQRSGVSDMKSARTIARQVRARLGHRLVARERQPDEGEVRRAEVHVDVAIPQVAHRVPGHVVRRDVHLDGRVVKVDRRMWQAGALERARGLVGFVLRRECGQPVARRDPAARRASGKLVAAGVQPATNGDSQIGSLPHCVTNFLYGFLSGLVLGSSVKLARGSTTPSISP